MKSYTHAKIRKTSKRFLKYLNTNTPIDRPTDISKDNGDYYRPVG